jgi:phosphatidate cytidylyltransferase
MKRVLTAVVLIPLVLLVVFRAPLWLFALAVAAIIVLALHEYLALAETAGFRPFHRATYAAAIFPTLVLWDRLWNAPGSAGIPRVLFANGDDLVRAGAALLMLSPIIFGIPLVFRKDLKTALGSSASSAFGVAYLGLSLSLLTALRASPFDKILVPFVLFSVWAGDIAAYYVGRSFGKHKLAPIVSPNKSWEGAIASIVASVLISVVVFHYRQELSHWFGEAAWLNRFWRYTVSKGFLDVPWGHVIAIGILTNIAAQFGDLFESALKRGAGVKDSGTLLPGHGGILDRIDALLFAIPVVWYYASLTGFLQPKTF